MMRYVLITPAHNEEAHLETTIQAVAEQTEKPHQWIIVNDGSNDRTGAIAEHAAAKLRFLRTLTIKRTGNHSFGNKARAFNSGLELLKGLDYELVGNLDADISFEPNYFKNLIKCFETDGRLGITGGSVYTKIGDGFACYDTTLDSVGGAVQLFRRECFDDIGGAYLPLPFGGIDAAAEIMAKGKGWSVRKSRDDKVREHRRTGSATASPLAAAFRLGRRFHSLGYGAVFYCFRCLYRLGNPPMFLGSCAELCGFFGSVIQRRPICLPPPVVEHLRREQRSKLLQTLRLGGRTSQPQPHEYPPRRD